MQHLGYDRKNRNNQKMLPAGFAACIKRQELPVRVVCAGTQASACVRAVAIVPARR